MERLVLPADVLETAKTTASFGDMGMEHSHSVVGGKQEPY